MKTGGGFHTKASSQEAAGGLTSSGTSRAGFTHDGREQRDDWDFRAGRRWLVLLRWRAAKVQRSPGAPLGRHPPRLLTWGRLLMGELPGAAA